MCVCVEFVSLGLCVYPSLHSAYTHECKYWVCAGLDLLSRMLKFDPAERITVDEALKHPYLSALHDPEDEPSSVPEMFDFSWDKDSMSEAELRSHLWDQALLFHPLDRPEDEEDDSEIPLVFTDGH